jgi:hypothetical protein
MERNASAIEIGPSATDIANAQGYASSAAASAASAAASAAAAAPVKVSPALLLHPYMGRGYGQFWAAGWKPHGFNQQWGGPWGGALPDGSGGDAWFDTGYLGFSEVGLSFRVDATKQYASQAFKVSKTDTYDRLWVHISSITGSLPSGNMRAQFFVDGGSGTVGVTAGSMCTVSSQILPSTGGWVLFEGFAASLTAGASYRVRFDTSWGNDSSNYINLSVNTAGAYPHGTFSRYESGSWVEHTGTDLIFALEAPDGLLQTGGIFSDGKLSLIEDDPAAPYIPAKYLNNISHEAGTLLWRGKVSSVSKPILDLMTGSLDSNRIRLSTTAAGKAYVELWESDGTPHSIEGSTDITNGGAGDTAHDVAVVWTTAGITLYVDAASEGTPVSSTITLDESLKDQGVLMSGGFPSAPSWDYTMNMSVLPSSDGWSYLGTGTESAVYDADGSILRRVLSGGTSVSCAYSRTNPFTNATGGAIAIRTKVLTPGEPDACTLFLDDGTIRAAIKLTADYIAAIGDTTSYIPFDLRTKPVDIVLSYKEMIFGCMRMAYLFTMA